MQNCSILNAIMISYLPNHDVGDHADNNLKSKIINKIMLMA